jgi:PAS domain S-box-containing protein
MSMSTRLVVWLSGVAAVLLLLTSVLQYRTSVLRIRQEHEHLIQALGDRLSATLRGPVFGFDEQTVQDILHAEMDAPQVVALGVWVGDRARPMAAKFRSGTATGAQWLARLPDGCVQSERRLLAPVSSGGAAIGRVVMVLDERLAYQRMWWGLLQQGVQQFLLVAILVCLLAVVLQRLLLDPLEGIRQSMLAVEAAAHTPAGLAGAFVPPLGPLLAGSFQELREIGAAHASMVLALARNNQALRRNEEELRITLDSLADAVIATDAAGRVLRVNAAARPLLTCAFEDACPQPLSAILPLHDLASGAPLADFPAVLLWPETPRPFRVVRPPRNPPGAEYILDLLGAPLPRALGERPGCVLVLRDVTEHVKIEEQLRQSQKMESIGRLAGGVAHDFNNQLGGVLGFAELLCEQLENPVYRKYAESIMIAAQRAADLTRQLLAFGRKGKYQAIPVDVHQMLEEVMALLRRSIDKRIEIRPRLEASPATVSGDPTQLQNAFLNLALNARDAMPQGGVLGFHTAVVRLAEPLPEEELAAGAYVQVQISDTGVGMDAATRVRLFEPFFTTKEVGKGTGLGLASVYGTIKNHGGAIRVESEPGQGSTFTLLLPLRVAADAGVAAAELPALAPRRQGAILIVDDEPLLLQLGAAILGKAGFRVATCQDPVEALARFPSEWADVDLVILDMNMPRMNGRELFERLRQLRPGLRVILATGYSLDGEAQEILNIGVQGFVAKPFHGKDLLRAVTALLAPQGAPGKGATS